MHPLNCVIRGGVYEQVRTEQPKSDKKKNLTSFSCSQDSFKKFLSMFPLLLFAFMEKRQIIPDKMTLEMISHQSVCSSTITSMSQVFMLGELYPKN